MTIAIAIAITTYLVGFAIGLWVWTTAFKYGQNELGGWFVPRVIIQSLLASFLIGSVVAVKLTAVLVVNPATEAYIDAMFTGGGYALSGVVMSMASRLAESLN